MRSTLYTLRLLLGLLCFSILVACSGSKDSIAVVKPEIDTLNLYLDSTKIFSFNPETGLSVERGEFNAGRYMAFPLDTNEDKQGFETLAFVKDDTLFVMDTVTAEITPLAVAANFICGIFPSFSATQNSFDKDDNQRIFFHQSLITIATQNGASCDPETDTLFQVAFDLIDDSEGIEITEINSSLSFGANILDFNFSENLVEGDIRTVKNGRSGFLGYDRNGQQVQMFDNERTPLWESSLSFVDAIPNLRQVASDKMLIQSDAQLFVLNIGELFSIAEINGNNGLPLESKLESLFDNPVHVLSSNDNPVRAVGNDVTFFFEDGDKLYFFPDLNQNVSEVFTRDSNIVVDLAFGITSDNTLILLKIFDTSVMLSQVNPETKFESTLFNNAEAIDFLILDDGFYVNTLNAGGLTGWQAHWFDTRDENQGAVQTTYSNSRFIFTDDTRSGDATILFLSSDDSSQPQPMLTPGFYAFNPEAINGRGILYGRLNSDVFSIKNSEIINDIYGLIDFEALHDDGNNQVNVTETYYFNPTQDDSSGNSLQLIKR